MKIMAIELHAHFFHPLYISYFSMKHINIYAWEIIYQCVIFRKRTTKQQELIINKSLFSNEQSGKKTLFVVSAVWTEDQNTQIISCFISTVNYSCFVFVHIPQYNTTPYTAIISERFEHYGDSEITWWKWTIWLVSFDFNTSYYNKATDGFVRNLLLGSPLSEPSTTRWWWTEAYLDPCR